MNQYTRIWRNKFLTVDATSLEEMVGLLTEARDELAEMLATGKITLDDGGGVGDDYAFLMTSDAEIANKYGFEKEDYEEDEFEEECELVDKE